jgi:multimeric flavodoxin WrbA
MKHHILIINGSSRKGGNTDTLVKAFSEGARMAGIQVQQIAFRDLSISDCGGCCECRDEGTCSIKDDMSGIREEIKKADILVLASPLYFCSVSGLMKTFLDRMYFFYHERNKVQIANKKVIVLVPLGEKESGHETRIIEEFFERYLHALDLVMLNMVFFPGLMEKGATKEHPEMVDRAYYAGRSLQIMFRKLDISAEMKILKLQFGVPKRMTRAHSRK